jgi:hypothetical protein
MHCMFLLYPQNDLWGQEMNFGFVWYTTEWLRNRGLIPSRHKKYFSFPVCRLTVRPTQAVSIGYWGVFLGDEVAVA